ncbi:hypothetical protein [Isoptericola sp. BMS4]|uniref:hypothetical protein n=1 Tax=Isoptericola sp. BMS4 TaxID=2527875 RepID=UPI001420E8D0|nr:hypothetical protein [Isoptericola sp. BMS4]
MTGEGRRYLTDRGIESVPMRDAAHGAPQEQRVGERIIEPTDPIPVRVWIEARQSGNHECDGYAIGWTDRQVHVRYIDTHGREGWTWVWANAVTRT